MRSTRGTFAVVAALAMMVGVVAPVASAGAATARASVVDWTQVPGATPDDLIVNPYSNYLGSYLGPGFSYTGRASGIADFCAATDATGSYPCPFSDFHNYFTLNSATANGLGATINVTVTNTHSTSNYLSFTSDSRDTWQQVFSTSSHGWLNFAELIGGQQVGQSSTNQVVCQLGVPCTVNFSMTDDYGKFIGNKWLATSLNVASQIFIPLNVSAPPATPPTSSFSASLSGTGAHDWAFDGSASTAVSPNTVASYQWTYGDGSTETTTNATTHRSYADGMPHTASLIVVDSAGTPSSSVSHTLTEPALIVNSTGDAPATDPSRGCDTGGTIGTPPVPECTLRAAIQSLDAGVGGQKISFALPAGSTTITATSPLPDITKAGATIDGTEDSGSPTISGSGLKVTNAAGVTITKVSVVASGDFGVLFDNSPGATLTSSSIGVSASGTVAAPKFAVAIYSSGAVTVGGPGAGNVIAATQTALSVNNAAAISSLIVQDNSIGEFADGTLIPGVSGSGVVILVGSDAPVTGAVISGNQIAGFTTNLTLAGAELVSPQVTGNRIGVAADQDSLLGAPQVNLRLDGVPGAVVSGNQIAGASYDVLVSGNMQVEVQPVGDGTVNIRYHIPGDVGLNASLTGPLSGTGDTISGNRIGTATRPSRVNVAAGVEVWNTADDTTISGNTVLNHDDTEIGVSGSGARLNVTGNTVGASSADSVSLYRGIKISGVQAPTVSRNAVGGVFWGIQLDSSVTGAVVSGNTVGFGTNGAAALPIGYAGIEVDGPNAIVGPDNTVGNSARSGIYIGGAHSQVFSNRVGVAKFGSSAAPNLEGITASANATGAVIGGTGKGNTIVGNGTGLKLQGAGADVGNNTFGLITSGPLGNGTAIDVSAAASVHDNTIANSTTQAVKVTGPAVTLSHNTMYATAGGVGVIGAPAAPQVLAAAQVVHGSSARTFLVIRNVPTTPGTIEVFGNASCGDPEGRYPLFTTPTTSDATRVISVADRAELAGLTVMVTTAGATTVFSNCVTSAAAPDTDGDGIPDVVEAAYPSTAGLDGTARSAAFVADNQQWVALSANGELSNVSPIDDPDPSGHPGASFPLGLIDWTVSGIDPGSFATVSFILPGAVINGWWKYSPNHTPAFFDYGYSPIAGYGATVVVASSPVSGVSTSVVVKVPDGGVGDDDGLENGIVHDPSAPAVIAGAPTILPVTQTSLPTPALTVPAATRSTALARTGSDPAGGIGSGLLAVLCGLVLLGIRRLHQRRTPTVTERSPRI